MKSPTSGLPSRVPGAAWRHLLGVPAARPRVVSGACPPTGQPRACACARRRPLHEALGGASWPWGSRVGLCRRRHPGTLCRAEPAVGPSGTPGASTRRRDGPSLVTVDNLHEPRPSVHQVVLADLDAIRQRRSRADRIAHDHVSPTSSRTIPKA